MGAYTKVFFGMEDGKGKSLITAAVHEVLMNIFREEVQTLKMICRLTKMQ